MGVAKILVVGSVHGQLKKAFEKISKLQSKQQFTLAIVVGDLFGADGDASQAEELEALLRGHLDVPLPVYFTVGTTPLPASVAAKLEADEDVCANLFYLGRKGTMMTVDGIKMVALGGRLAPDAGAMPSPLGKCDPWYIDQDARGLHGAHSAHLLLTTDWPADITNGSRVPLPDALDGTAGSRSIATLCQTLQPWYHFASSPAAMWEREPFQHTVDYDSLEQAAVTRFKSLPGVTAPTKEWMTAFSLDTSRPPPTVERPGLSPFTRHSPPQKRRAAAEYEESYSSSSHPHRHEGRASKRARRETSKDANDCFMCLNRPDAKTHLVVSLGDESMVTVSRGPLPLPSTFPALAFTGHAMIIPYYHAADEMAHGARSRAEVATEFQEMNGFRRALSTMIGSKSQGRLGSVCWELNRTGIRHHHWQVTACGADAVKKGLVAAAFKVLAEQKGYPALEPCDPAQPLPVRSDYFRIWTWVASPVDVADQANGSAGDGDSAVGTTQSLYFALPGDQKFNIWFGREVMAGMLRLEDRVNWVHALLHKDGSEQLAEEEDAQGLRDDFAEFDFAMK